MRNPTLRQLRSVLAVERLGKINLAAREIGLTPSAITLQIQQLEGEAGVALFDRTGEGLRPTDAGRAVVAAARAIENRLTELSDELAAVGEARRGTLRLGAVSTAKYFAPFLVAAFKAEHPGIELRLTVGNRAATIEALANQSIDVALMGRPPRRVAVQPLLIGEHPLVVVARPDHPLAAERRIAKSRIAEETFLIREPGSGTRSSFDVFFGDLPGRLDEPGFEFVSNETIKQAVMAGLGIGFISAHTIATEIELGRLAILDVVDTPVRRQWFAVSRTDRAPSPTMSAFREFIVRRGREFLPALVPAAEKAA